MESLFKICLCAVLIMAASINGTAQIPSNPIGNNDPGLKWQQIQTDKVRVIFPKGLQSQANRITNIVHTLWDNDSPSIGSNHRKVPIILQPQTVLSNGFVTVAPFRSEFFARAPQFDGTTDWLDHLTIHEYQHIKQFNQTRQGISGLVSKVLGEWAWGGMIGLAIPRWYYEGDAVIVETAFTKSGRGRLPDFTMEYKSLLQKGITYNYEKAAAGSIRDYVPNWYNLGYHLLTYGRQQYGPDLWKHATADAVKYKGLFYAFNRSVKRQTGKKIKTLYAEMMDDFASHYQSQKKNLAADHSKLLYDKHKGTVVHYSNPQFIDSQTLWVQEFGYDRIRAFKKMNLNGGIIAELRPGFLLDGALSQSSVVGDKLVWAELGWDIRRQYKRFSEIVLYDMATQTKTRLTKNGFDYSPSLSRDGSQIAIIRVDDKLIPRIVILDSATGETLKEISNPKKKHLTFSRWLNDQTIVAVARSDQQNQLQKIDVATGEYRPFGEATEDPITHLAVVGRRVYFSKPINDINQIFSMDIKSEEVFQLTHDPVGAFQPTVSSDGKQLAYSSFSNMGYDVKLLDLEVSEPVAKKSLQHQYQSPYLKSLIAQEKANLLAGISTDTFELKSFNRFSGLVKPHSLLANFTMNSAELSVLSDNVFSTLSADATATYRYNEDAWRYSVGLTYAELFPEVSLRAERVGRSALLYNFDMVTDSTVQERRYVERWRENRLNAGLFVPLNFSSGQTSKVMSVATRINRHQLQVDQNFDNPDFTVADTINLNQIAGANQVVGLVTEPLGDVSFSSIDLIWSGRIQRFTARQHLRSRLGVSAFFRYRTPLGDAVDGSVFQASGNVFLPGLAKNHSLSFDVDYQTEAILSQYRFSDNFDYARGYNRTLRADQLTKFGVSYRLPLWYPDVAVGGLAFLKRVKANVFYDHGLVGFDTFPFAVETNQMRSVGVELGFDVRFLRLLEVDLGVRYSYLMDEDYAIGSRHSFNFFLLSIGQ